MCFQLPPTGFNFLNISAIPEEQSSTETESNSFLLSDEIAKPLFQKMNQAPRRTQRKISPSRKVRENLQNKTSGGSRSKISRKKKATDKIPVKKLQMVTEQEFLHHYPITTSKIDDLFSELEDQEKTIHKLHATEVKKLDIAIRNSEATGAYPGISIVPLGENLGFGAFIDPKGKKLNKGTILGIYSGEYKIYQTEHLKDIDLSYAFELTDIICLEEEEHLAHFGDLNTWCQGDYMIYCDAKEKGNWTRFLNHGGKSANCTAQLVKYPPKGKMGADAEKWIVIIYVLETIRPGEQLLLDYGESYWEKYGVKPIEVTPSHYKLQENGSISIS